MPDFILPGAMRAGTTTLADVLTRNDRILVTSPKEPHFFVHREMKAVLNGPGDDILRSRIIDDEQAYLNTTLHDYACRLGDASTGYFHFADHAAPRLSGYNPGMLVLPILRNPIERAYSSFLYLRSRGREPLNSFEDALAAEPDRIERGWGPMWHYVDAGFYVSRLEAFWRAFPKEQVHVATFEDLVLNPGRLVADIARMLGVEVLNEELEIQAWNKSGVARSNVLMRVLFHRWSRRIAGELPGSVVALGRSLHERNMSNAEPMRDETRRKLRTVYEKDIHQLSDLLERDLSHWLLFE